MLIIAKLKPDLHRNIKKNKCKSEETISLKIFHRETNIEKSIRIDFVKSNEWIFPWLFSGHFLFLY